MKKLLLLITMFILSITSVHAIDISKGIYIASANDTPLVYGCTDDTAKNYNSNATVNQGCIYWVYGCMDRGALNYNSSAEKADGSCLYPPADDEITEMTNAKTKNTSKIIGGAVGLSSIIGGVSYFMLKKR